MPQLQLLGPVQLRVADRLVDLGSPKQRLVLAALAIDPGLPVSVETLIDRVWAVDLPADPRAVLYGYLTRIRRALAAGDGSRPWLLRQPAGYLLDIDPEWVDLHRFSHLTRQARDPQCTDADRLRLLREALALWRGDPLAGLPGDWVERIRRGWHRRRLDAVVAWADAELVAGDPAAVVAPVAELLDQHPLVEPLVAVLMRALHATGQGARALARYAAFRERLAEDLGADPGEELVELHRSMLRGDLIRPRAATRSGPVPRQLPAGVPGFVGRVSQLAELDRLLDNRDQPEAVVISALSGTAGIGKTALAVHWAQRVADRFPDGQLYVNLRGFDPSCAPMPADEAVRGFLDALGVPSQQLPATQEAQVGLYRSLLTGKRMLVLLDNARDADHVRPLLPGAPGCLALVTSRNQLTSLVAAEGARPLGLDLLPDDEARQLLANRAGADRVAAEPAAVDEIIARCGRLPLALAIVAARAATRPTFRLRALADELRHGLEALSADDPATGVRAVFSWSYRALEPATARMFRLLGLHHCPSLAPPAAASLAGVPLAEARRLLTGLAGTHLVTETAPGRYWLHDLLCAYAAEQAAAEEDEADRRAAVHRMLDYYLRTAHAAAMALNPHREQVTPPPAAAPGVALEDSLDDPEQALAWFTAERRELYAAVGWAAEAGLDVHAWQLAWALRDYGDRLGHWHDQVAAFEVALAAAERLDDRSALAWLHRALAWTLARLARDDDGLTHLTRARDLYRDLGDRTGYAHTLLNLGIAFQQLGRPHEALSETRQALEIYRSEGEPVMQAYALNTIGYCSSLLGDHESALSDLAQALSLYRAAGDRHGEACTWDSLGFARRGLGHRLAATACYQRAIDLFHDTGNRFQQAGAFERLGDHHEASGEPEAARRAWRKAAEIFDELDHPDAGRVRAKLVELLR